LGVAFFVWACRGLMGTKVPQSSKCDQQIRRFAEEVGMSPGRWLIKQRVDRARHPLETTDQPVDEIAGQVGFASGTSLREHLHAAIGISPLLYWRTFREALSS
jgi:transcriptional regulator GlxA family with amidase domain